jgi:hypothetical protein
MAILEKIMGTVLILGAVYIFITMVFLQIAYIIK